MSGIRILSDKEESDFLMGLGMWKSYVPWPGVDVFGVDFKLREWKKRRNLVAVLLMLDAGLRVGEVIGVIFPDVYFEDKPVETLVVRKEIAKGRRQRMIPITFRLETALSRFNAEPYLLKDWPLTQPLIARYPQGPALTTRALQKLTKRVGLKSCGVEINPHMLRHTLATRLMQVTDIRTVQMILGHKNVSTTQIYTHPSSEDARKAIQALSTGKPVGSKQLGEYKGESDEIPKIS